MIATFPTKAVACAAETGYEGPMNRAPAIRCRIISC